MSESNQTVLGFSSHLFWDVRHSTLNTKKHKRLIVERVIERGSRRDLALLLSTYKKKEIREAVKEIPVMNPRDMAFVHTFFDIPYKQMKCYTKKRSVLNF